MGHVAGERLYFLLLPNAVVWCISLSVMRLSCAETAEWIDVLFGVVGTWGHSLLTVRERVSGESCHVKYGSIARIQCTLRQFTFC